MSDALTIEILSDGRMRFKRGTKQHNDNMIEVLSNVVDDPKIMEEIICFFKGSEDVELLMGDTIFCG